MHLPHRIEKVAILHVFNLAFGTQSVDDTGVGRIVVVVAHHHDFRERVLSQDGVGDMTAEVGSSQTSGK